MNRLMNVEHNPFMQKNIDIYRQNKVGQYSKFLDKTVIFQTYYHVNQVMTTVDVGTGGITDYLGPSSPVRYNKITGFPVCNIPDLKPDLITDESGSDIELDLSDVTILPGTIIPLPGDHMVIDVGGEFQFLFQVDNIRYNTIQSGDFYLIDLHLRRTGKHVEKTFWTQIVETYTTVFDNIGTEDKCFLRDTDVANCNAIGTLFYKLRDLYKDAYYNSYCNSFIMDYGFTEDGDSQFLYDAYLEKFINQSNLFYEAGQDETLVLTPNDILDYRFDYNFQRTLYYALLNRTKDMLLPYIFYYTDEIEKRHSPFRVNSMNVRGVHLHLSDGPLMEASADTPITTKVKKVPACVPTYTLTNANVYFDMEYIKHIQCGDIKAGMTYYEQLIFDHMNHVNSSISVSRVIQNFKLGDRETFYLTPLVLYILQEKYDQYFKKSSDIEVV